MSVENLKKFGQMCAEDEKIRDKVKEIGLENPEGWMEYSKELGVEFSMADMQALSDEVGPISDELSEDQLEQVAGGVVTTTAAVVVGAVCGVVVASTAVNSSVRRGW